MGHSLATGLTFVSLERGESKPVVSELETDMHLSHAPVSVLLLTRIGQLLLEGSLAALLSSSSA